ncbi:MAG: hypothetical protein Q8942_10090 [Bacillota bacterium]|nr:hypothetical protein [Bacillota bacterium]
MAFGVLVIIFFAFIIVFSIFQMENRERQITEKIQSIGGTVISIERRNFFSGIGPFLVVGRGRVVYRIEYRLDDRAIEGWVRFGGLFGPDWRL